MEEVEETEEVDAPMLDETTAEGENESLTLAQVTTAARIAEECSKICDMLLEKNRKYGNSALVPVRIFSQAPVDEQLNVRIDDKLSRIRSSQPDDLEDAELDLIGYLILKRISRYWRVE